MTTLLIITTISIVFSTIWLLKKPKSRYLEKVVTKIHFVFLGLSVTSLFLLLKDLKFIGHYTNSIIGITFVLSGILIFGLTKSKLIKVYSGLIAIPAFFTEVSLLFGGSPLVFFSIIAYLMFAAPLKKIRINDKYNLEIHEGGLMAPPNLFYLTKQTGIVFDKQIRLTTIETFSNISKIEVIGFKENDHIVCKFYNGESINEYSIDTLRYIK